MSMFPKIQLKLNKKEDKTIKHDEIKSDIMAFSLDSNDAKLNVIVTNILVNIVADLLKDISKEYTLNLDDLREKYMKNFDKSKTYNLLINKLLQVDKTDHIKLCSDSYSDKKQNGHNEYKSENIDTNKCYARIRENKQCSRKKGQGQGDFCGTHIHNRPFGRIDEEQIKSNGDQEVKKRGRPKGGSKKNQITEDKYVIEETETGSFLICLEDNKMYNIPDNVEDGQVNTHDLVHVGFKIGDEYKFI